MRWRSLGAVAAFVLLSLPPWDVTAFPVDGDHSALPAGSELNEDALAVPREALRSEYRGDRTSYLYAEPKFVPIKDFTHGGRFGLAELINVALDRQP